MKSQKAQGIVEFALVLPLFFLLVMSIVYFGMAFADYLTMSNTVRSVAHEASLQKTDADYQTVVKSCTKDVVLVNDIFIWKPDSSSGKSNKYLTVSFNSSSKNVEVVAKADFNKDSTIGNVISNFLGESIKDSITINYSMYSGVRSK